jgi:hypothetical protein
LEQRRKALDRSRLIVGTGLSPSPSVLCLALLIAIGMFILLVSQQ